MNQNKRQGKSTTMLHKNLMRNYLNNNRTHKKKEKKQINDTGKKKEEMGKIMKTEKEKEGGREEGTIITLHKTEEREEHTV